MPEISRFYGIVIGLFTDEHPPPHFHVRYGDHFATIEIKTATLVEGKLPGRVLGRVTEWAALHREELLRAWNEAQAGRPPGKIPPLE